MLAQAEMRTEAGRDLRIGRTIEAKGERIGENLFIAIGGWIAHHQAVTGPDLWPRNALSCWAVRMGETDWSAFYSR